jgi:hypothetical protein
MKDALTQSFSNYLTNQATLLQIVSDIVNADSKIQMHMLKETERDQLVDDPFFRLLRIGLSRAIYYQKKIEDVDMVDIDMVVEAREELDPLYEKVKQRMQTLE